MTFWFDWLMVFNATFNNIYAISWAVVVRFIVEENGIPDENY
jgi:hypothetical protein